MFSDSNTRTRPGVCPNTAEALSRRAFFGAAVAAAGKGSAVVLGLPAILAACERADEARRSGRGIDGLRNLAADEAAELQAMAARIMPRDETPGAEEAGVIYFMDHALTDPAQLQTLREGLADLQQRVQARYGGGTGDSDSTGTANNDSADNGTGHITAFHQLQPAQQDELLQEIEEGEFFRSVRFLTMAGMFSLPEYGGNQNLAGYQALAYEPRHAWAPPFGYYDSDAAQ